MLELMMRLDQLRNAIGGGVDFWVTNIAVGGVFVFSATIDLWL